MKRILKLVYKDHLMGHLSANEDSSELNFSYDKEWLLFNDRFPLSPTIHFDGQYTSQEIMNFFRNILPEGNNLEALSSKFGVSKSESFELLKRIGIDLTAAFTLVPDSIELDTLSNLNIEDTVITYSELSKKIVERGHNNLPFGWWNGKMRISMAGYQEKIGVKVINDKLFMPDGYKNHSSHIMKPPSREPFFASMIGNEAYCMEISRKIGLETANTKIIHVPEPVLLIERFDRVLEGKLYSKLHQIDGAQLLNLSPNFKVERRYGNAEHIKDFREGASLPKLALAIDKYAKVPLIEKRKFVDWIVFQLCIGNTDAHAKNISFFVDNKGISITPFYDQVSTSFYDDDKLDSTLSMAVDDTFELEKVSAYDLACMCLDCNLPSRMLGASIIRISDSILKLIEEDNFEMCDDFGIKDELFSHIKEHSIRLKKVISDHKSFNGDLISAYEFEKQERELRLD